MEADLLWGVVLMLEGAKQSYSSSFSLKMAQQNLDKAYVRSSIKGLF